MEKLTKMFLLCGLYSSHEFSENGGREEGRGEMFRGGRRGWGWGTTGLVF